MILTPSQANSLPSSSISELEHEFKQHLSSCSKPVEPDRLYECLPSSLRPSSGSHDASNKDPYDSHKTDYNPLILIPPLFMSVLHDLAQQMVNAGHTQQYLIIYRDSRSQPLLKSLQQLGAENLSKDDMQKIECEILDLKIGTWIRCMRIAVKLLFVAERKVCDEMFEGIKSLKDQCFFEVTQGSVDIFGDAVANCKRSPGNTFVLLDMYEVMCELHTEIETLFSSKACKEVIEATVGLTKQLAKTIIDTLGDFEEAVVKYDAHIIDVADGTVHPVTSYVIKYVKFLFDYKSSLNQLLQESENGDESNNQLASVTMRIIQALLTNLEVKSKQLKDPALTNLFLMNNIHYMALQTDLLADEWMQKYRRMVQQHANQYQIITFTKILQSLSIEGVDGAGGKSCWASDRTQNLNRSIYRFKFWKLKYNKIEDPIRDGLISKNKAGIVSASQRLVKDRLKKFNLQFEEIHQRQSQWTVPDTELKESLRLAAAEVLLPAYTSFIEYFGLAENGKKRHKYLRYSTEDLDRMLGEFFNGKTL